MQEDLSELSAQAHIRTELCRTCGAFVLKESVSDAIFTA